VDFIATDLNDLLKQLDGFSVQMESGPRILHTANAVVESLPMNFGEDVLDILIDTNIVFLLMTVGLLAILLELSAPGGWVAGFIGVMALALSVYGLGILPVNWFGAIFLVLALILFVLDIKAPTHGALTLAGIGSFIVGALVLFNSPNVPQFQRVSVPLVIAVSSVLGICFAIILGFALRAQKTPLRMGQETLIGAMGTAKGRLIGMDRFNCGANSGAQNWLKGRVDPTWRKGGRGGRRRAACQSPQGLTQRLLETRIY